MKTVLAMLMSMSVMVLAGYTYTYPSGMDFDDLTLTGNQSVLVDGGGGHYLNLLYYSTAKISNTSPLTTEGNGGIWQIVMGGYSSNIIEGGEIHHLDLGSYAQAQISSGRIDLLSSSQNATYTKHIEMICKAGYLYNSTTGYLTGLWADGSVFNIKLINVSGYSPTIDNIKFIIVPEPATLLLIGLGGLFLRQRRK